MKLNFVCVVTTAALLPVLGAAQPTNKPVNTGIASGRLEK